MYVDHFKLDQRPFVQHAGTGFFTPNMAVAAVISRLEQVLLARDAVSVITGGPGVGKTALVEKALAGVADRAIVAHLDLRHTDPELACADLLLELGADVGDVAETTSLHQLRGAIRSHNDSGRMVTAAIDVIGLTVERATTLLRLVHLTAQPGGQLNIILLGPHNLHKVMDIPGLIHFRQRVCFRHQVRPFTLQETTDYLTDQFQAAGGNAADIMADGIPSAVYRFVAGVPRLINTLMDAALSEAAVQHLDQLTPDHIGQVAQRLGWKPLAQRAAAKAAPVASPAPTPTQQTAPPAKPQKPVAVAPKPPPVESAKPAKPAKPAQEDDTPEWLKPDPEAMVPVEPPPPPRAPSTDATAALMMSTLKLDEVPKPAAQEESAAEDESREVDSFSETVPAGHAEAAAAAAFGGVPAMDPDDTSATGMLRLEDLDEKFAETVFGEGSGVFAALVDADKKKTGDQHR